MALECVKIQHLAVTGPKATKPMNNKVSQNNRLPVILASGSPYRRELLARILPDFRAASPEVDETALPDEAPEDMARRLARLKADSLAAGAPDALVIGSDQVPVLGQQILRKPGTAETAARQLADCAGQTVIFYTAVCIRPPSNTGTHEQPDCHVDITTVTFRTLTAQQIERYLAREKPFDCAGSFKAEGLGIALLERIDSEDPTGLQGLPLIWLSNALSAHGVNLY
jgi:septum formation protein